MDLQDTGATAVRYLIRDRDTKYTTTFNTVLADSGITTTTIGIRMPRMNAIMERWIRTCRNELLDRTLIHNSDNYSTHSANTKTSTDPTAHSTPQHHNAHNPNPLPA
jgi:hypothetical protein